MKPTRALLVCSVLGALWLSSCSSATKKPTQIPIGDAGAAGEATASAGAAGDSAEAGAGGDAGAAASDAGAGGEVSLAGQGGDGGAAPACFNVLTGSAGGLGGEGGEGPVAHRYTCGALLNALSPVYDAANGSLKLDGTLLGPAAQGSYTVFYRSFDGELHHTECFDDLVQALGTQLTLPIQPEATDTEIEVTGFSVVDSCGNEATLETTGNDGCTNLRLTANGDDTWSVDCQPGNCHTTTCAEFSAQ